MLPWIASTCTIHKSGQLIGKLKQMKQGLLHDLLTRGIDDNGELRDPGRHPDQFQESRLGRLPRAWKVIQLGRYVDSQGGFLQTGPFGSQLHAYEYLDGEGVPVVMPQDLLDETITTAGVARVSHEKAIQLSRHRMMANDVVFARRGDLSRCASISFREEGWLCGTGCLLARLPNQGLNAGWLAALYRHGMVQDQVAARAVGSTMVNLNTRILASLSLPIPPKDEQDAVADVYSAHMERIRREEEGLAKLRIIKQGLMEDLLTGRVRVTDLATTP